MSDCLSMAGAKVGSGSGLDRLLAAQSAGCDFLMLTHQHNNPEPNKPQLLDDLLVAINAVPDNPDSARRRARFALPLAPKKTEDCKESSQVEEPLTMQAIIDTLTRVAATTKKTTAAAETRTAPSSMITPLRDAKKNAKDTHQQQNTGQGQNTESISSVLNKTS